VNKIDETELAARVAEQLNRAITDGRRPYVFQVVQETFRVTGLKQAGDGGTLVDFEFQGMVQRTDEPVTYLASGSLALDPDGRMVPGSLKF
jgi:hypothetical protein